ncbi:MAG: contractile injection system tape measure protein [Flavobacteriaceae bacterium]
MVAAKNIIKKLTVEVDTNSMAIALQLKDDLSSFFSEKVGPVLDEVISKKIAENKFIRLDNLSLSIELNPNEKLENILPKIISKTEEAIEEIDLKSENENDSNTRLNNTQKRVQEAFIYYLKKGQYPWWFDENHQFTEDDIKTINKEQLRTIFNSNNCLDRFIYQFDLKLIILVYSVLNNTPEKANKKLGNIPTLLQKEAVKASFWRMVFKQRLSPNPSHFIEAFHELISREFISENKSILLRRSEVKKLQNVLEFCVQNLSLNIQLEESKKEPNQYFLTWNNEGQKAQKIQKIFTENNTVLQIKKDPFLPSSATPSESTFREENSLQDVQRFEADLEEGILVKNTGLILIHPFIKHFFEKLEFLSENSIKPEKIDEAIHILHYLACKKLQPYEHELVFEKYLCHVPLHFPIKKRISLTAAQLEACEELLKAILNHWETLKTKNTEVLRSEFLMREGKLKIASEKDTLYIQRKTQDILLDTLPWNFHIVKIPWKQKILFINW